MKNIVENRNRETYPVLDAEGFYTALRFAVEDRLKGVCTVANTQRYKNNGTVREALEIRKTDNHLSSLIYVDESYKSYQSGTDFDEIADSIVRAYLVTENTIQIEPDLVLDFDWACSRICLKLINAERNREMLECVPNKPFLDLAVVYHLWLDQADGRRASIQVTNGLIEKWGVDPEDLYDLALDNTSRLFPGCILGMQEMMDSIFGLDPGLSEKNVDAPAKDAMGMYVATNDKKLYGAEVILHDKLIRDFAAKMGRDFYILPSSVHELIFVLENGNMSPCDLEQMVHDVNADVVSDEDYLSGSVYIYHVDTGETEIAGGAR